MSLKFILCYRYSIPMPTPVWESFSLLFSSPRAFFLKSSGWKIIGRMKTCIEIYEVTETVKNCAIKKEELWMRKNFIIKESRKQNNQMCVGGFLVELSFSHIHVALCVLFPLEFVFCYCRLTWHIIKLYWRKGGKKSFS